MQRTHRLPAHPAPAPSDHRAACRGWGIFAPCPSAPCRGHSAAGRGSGSLTGRPPPLFTPGQGREVQGSELFQAARTSVWSARGKPGWFGHSSYSVPKLFLQIPSGHGTCRWDLVNSRESPEVSGHGDNRDPRSQPAHHAVTDTECLQTRKLAEGEWAGEGLGPGDTGTELGPARESPRGAGQKVTA